MPQGAKEGLSSSFVSAILASRDGSIWIAGDNGIDVLRDGRKRYPRGWPNRMKQTTFSLFEDHTGTIWISSANDLAYWEKDHFYILKRADGESLENVTGITEDAQHHLWALSHTSLFLIDHWQVQQRTPLPKGFAGPGLLAPDLQGGVWISDSANHMFNYRNGQFQTIELKDIGSTNAIEAMIADADDPLLIATLGGLFRWDGHRAGEAVRNAFRHAGASRIEVEIHYDPRRFRLRVRDNGKGIDPEVLKQGRAGHYGLASIHERAKGVGGKIAVWSEVGSGTEIELTNNSLKNQHLHDPVYCVRHCFITGWSC